MDVTAHALRYFLVLSEELHFGRAAARLHLTTPSLSEQIARLEKRVRTPLFTRGPRGVALTDAGSELVPLARQAVAAHDEVSRWAAAVAGEVRGTVRVGVVATVAAVLRADVDRALARAHPDVELTSRRLGFQEEGDALREGRVDVAFAPEPLPEPHRGLHTTTVATEPRVLVVPAGHRLAGRDAVSVEETNGEVFIGVPTSDPATLDWWLVDPRADGSHPSHGPVAADIDGVLDLVEAGRGLNIASAEVAAHYARPGVGFVPLSDVEDARVALCWRSDEQDPAVLATVAAVRRVATG